MAYQALYRKYRPKTFSEVVGQEHITETLKREIASGTTVHAYLFTGTRGTGKTSCAKILAKAINCTDSKNGDPCLECESCRLIGNDENTDIIEIDAASNNGVDNIREMRDLIGFSPANSKYRVYIIDEVHMLSIGAFNALLKTLEEPPEHVVFILATTEVHKLPATILSRCQRFDFRRIDNQKICERIQYIAGEEGITVTPDAATLIAAAADGGMRDALSILDLCASSNKNIDEQTVENVCSMAGNEYLIEFGDAINKKDTEKALLLVEQLHNSSVDMLRLLAELTSHFRDLMIVKTVKGENKPIVCSASRLKSLKNQAEAYDLKDILFCLSRLQTAAASMQTGNRRCELEMALIKMCNPSLCDDIEALERRIAAIEKGGVKTVASVTPEVPVTAKAEAATDITESFSEAKADNAPEQIKTVPIDDTEKTEPLNQWDDILYILKKENPLMAGVLAGSNAYIKGQYLLIDAPNSQFKTMINTGTEYKDIIRRAAAEVLGVTYKLGPYNKSREEKASDPLEAIANKLKNFEIN